MHSSGKEFIFLTFPYFREKISIRLSFYLILNSSGHKLILLNFQDNLAILQYKKSGEEKTRKGLKD